jgi:hypothetical protein
LADVEQQAQHLRSWALIQGATITAPAFLRLLGEGETCVVELPTSEAIVAPHKETGLDIEVIAEAPAIVLADVPFDQVRPAIRALRQQFGAECGRVGATDYRASDGNWATGTLTWHVRALPAELPAEFEVQDEGAAAVAPSAVPGPAPLAGRRFSLHWPRWRRQDG